MCTAAFVKRHIWSLSRGVLFTTRDVVSCGSRAAVDQTLYRLVKCGEIIRLARGVFVRHDWGLALPSALELATVKADSFARKILTHGADAAKALGLVALGNKEPTYITSGRSSSFRFGDTVIHFKGSSPRKMCRGDRQEALLIRSLWHLGSEECKPSAVSTARSSIGRYERQVLRQSGSMMPAWMWRHFHGLIPALR